MAELFREKPVQHIQLLVNGKPRGRPARVLLNVMPGPPDGANRPHGWCVTEPCPEEVTVKFLARLLRVKPFKVVADLLNLGVLANAEQTVPFEIALELLRQNGYTVQKA